MKQSHQAELLKNLYGLPTRKASLLKRGVGKLLGENRMIDTVFWRSVWPKRAWRHNLKAANLAFTVATMYAADPRQGDATLGQAIAVTAGTSVKASFERLLETDDVFDFCRRLAMFQAVLERDGPALDWAAMLRDVLWWENATWRVGVARKWKSSIY